ncbi:hypothetical protein [Neogemmobacter tilapiae]|uniref:hypothetical protein n=1 Tax=Neogemmobacter tilapiae TaxID=875041 RepID=UPI0016737067|nr:hypothetical protein [Gemmobacter tilapiae]
MRKSLCAMASCLFGLFPSFVLGEVCMRGEIIEVALGMEGAPSLHGCRPLFAFEDSFGAKGVFVNSMPGLTVSKSGRPQVHVRLESKLTWEELDQATLATGGTLETAISEYQLSLREIACAGGYANFLNAGGSLHITLTATKMLENPEPLELGMGLVTLIDLEIDTPQDCEAP